MTGPIDILWGWDAIAAALEVTIPTAKYLHANEGLPVCAGKRKQVQSTRALLQNWATQRAVQTQTEGDSDAEKGSQ